MASPVKTESKRLVPALAAFVALSAAAPAFEPPAIEWEKTVPFDVAEFMQVRPAARDGGYVLACDRTQTNEKGETVYSVVVIKTDHRGASLWEKSYQMVQVLPTAACPRSILPTSDGGYLLHCYGFDLMKLDSSGDLIWTKQYSRFYSSYNRRPIQETDDGGFVAAVIKYFFEGDVRTRWSECLIWMDADGNVMSEKPIGSQVVVNATPPVGTYDLEKTRDGSLVLGGFWWRSEAEAGLWLLKADLDGNVLWETKWDRGQAMFVRETSDGGYILACESLQKDPGGHAPLVVKADERGQVEWAHTEPPQPWGRGYFTNALETPGGGYLVLGTDQRLRNGESCHDVYLVWFDRTGERAWEKILSTGYLAYPYQLWLDQTTDGGYIVGFPDLKAPGELEFHVVKLAPPSQPAAPFLRGRTDGDGALNLTDAVCVLAYLFDPEGGACKQSVPLCLDAADANDDGKVGITDPICTLLHLFQGGPPLPGPTTACGPDPTPDELGCREFMECE
jgi:hypothetical protein